MKCFENGIGPIDIASLSPSLASWSNLGDNDLSFQLPSRFTSSKTDSDFEESTDGSLKTDPLYCMGCRAHKDECLLGHIPSPMIMIMENNKPHHLHRNVDWVKAAHLYKLNESSCKGNNKCGKNLQRIFGRICLKSISTKYCKKFRNLPVRVDIEVLGQYWHHPPGAPDIQTKR